MLSTELSEVSQDLTSGLTAIRNDHLAPYQDLSGEEASIGASVRVCLRLPERGHLWSKRGPPGTDSLPSIDAGYSLPWPLVEDSAIGHAPTGLSNDQIIGRRRTLGYTAGRLQLIFRRLRLPTKFPAENGLTQRPPMACERAASGAQRDIGGGAAAVFPDSVGWSHTMTSGQGAGTLCHIRRFQGAEQGYDIDPLVLTGSGQACPWTNFYKMTGSTN